MTSSVDDQLRAAQRNLAAVSDNGTAPVVATRPRFELTKNKNGIKSAPEHTRWLRTQIGTGALSWAFRRGNRVVRVAAIGEEGYIVPTGEHDSNGPTTVVPLTARLLSTRLAEAVFCYVERKNSETKEEYEEEEWFPVPDCERALDEPDELPFVRTVDQVTHTPIARPDGTILTTPGYDEATRTLYLPNVAVPAVPEAPTPEQLSAAVQVVRWPIGEFTWDGKHDEANYLGVMLTPLLRAVCPPPYKLFVLGARQPGSGKSLLAKFLGDVHGRVMRAETPHDDAEWAKSITSILTETTAPYVVFDNVSGSLSSSRLAGLLTTAEYSDRKLGSTNNSDARNDRIWTITANNAHLGGDLIRRALWCTVDPRTPHPEQRTGFRCNLWTWGEDPTHRGNYLWALLTLIAAWAAAGQPRPKMPSSDNYGHWVATVRGILEHAGIPGTFAHAESMQQEVGGEDEEWGEFLAAIDALWGTERWSVPGLIEQIDLAPTWDGAEPSKAQMVDPGGQARPAADLNVLRKELKAKLPAALEDKLGRSTTVRAIARSLGNYLRNRNGRWADGRCIRKSGGREGDGNIQHWKIDKGREG